MPQTSRQSKPVNVGIARWGAVGVIVSFVYKRCRNCINTLAKRRAGYQKRGLCYCGKPIVPRRDRHKARYQTQKGRWRVGAIQAPSDGASYRNWRRCNGQPVGSGVSFYQIQADQFATNRKMVVIK